MHANAQDSLVAAITTARDQGLTFSNSLASGPFGRIVGKIQATVQASMSYISVEGCTPRDGRELRYMIDHTTCPRLTLVPATNHSISDQLVIRRRVTIVGRPLGLPIIDAHNATRIVLVEDGGFLDVRFVQLVRGKAIEVISGLLFQVRGSTCYIRRGGVALFTGCRFASDWLQFVSPMGLSPPQTTLQITGGSMILEAGTLRVTDCQRITFGVGVVFREVQFIGGEFLVLSGSMYLTGCIFVSVSTFSNNLGAGGNIANLGGTVVVSGCLFFFLGAFTCTTGLGFRHFLARGTTIITGSIFSSAVGFAAYFGGGGDIFTGSGVAILTGLIFSGQAIMGIAAGFGFHAALGSGISIRTGFILSTMSALAFLTGCGMSNFVGAGVTVFSDMSHARSTALYSFYGCGRRLFLGAGTATLVNVVGFFNTGIGSLSYVGGDMVVLAGYVVRVNQLYSSTTAISFAVGQGADLFLGLGGATLVLHMYISPPPLVYYINPGLVTLYVAGNNVFESTAFGNSTTLYGTLTVNKHGQTDWGKNVFVARSISWQFTDVGPFPGDFGDDRRLGVRNMSDGGPSPETKKLKDTDRKSRSLLTPYHDTLQRLGLTQSFDLKPVLTELLNNYLPAEGVHSALNRDRMNVSQHIMRHGMERVNLQKALQDNAIETGKSRQSFLDVGIDHVNIRRAKEDHLNGSLLYPFAKPAGLELEHTKTDKIFLASPLDVCQICDVKPGNTFDSVDGPGAILGCNVEKTCAEPNLVALASTRTNVTEENGGEHLAAKQIKSRMWITNRAENPANTTIQQLELRTTFTPPFTHSSSPRNSHLQASIKREEVHAVLKTIISALGLSERYHLRVEVISEDEKKFHPFFLSKDSRHVGEEKFDYGSIGPEEMARQETCQRERVFKAYLVSDWKNITDEISRKLKTSTATRSLTSALQAEVNKTAVMLAGAALNSTDNNNLIIPPQICELLVHRTTSVYVPSTTLAGLGSTAAAVLETSPIIRRTTASSDLKKELSAKVADRELDENEIEEHDDQIQALLLRDASASLVLPVPEKTEPVALLRQLPPRVDAVLMGKMYSLVLSNFPRWMRKTMLTVRAVPEEGEEILIASFPSTPHPLTRQQVWTWTLEEDVWEGVFAEGKEYYLEVTSSDGVAFDMTNKFLIQ